jgi:hypothetical protein
MVNICNFFYFSATTKSWAFWFFFHINLYISWTIHKLINWFKLNLLTESPRTSQFFSRIRSIPNLATGFRVDGVFQMKAGYSQTGACLLSFLLRFIQPS